MQGPHLLLFEANREDNNIEFGKGEADQQKRPFAGSEGSPYIYVEQRLFLMISSSYMLSYTSFYFREGLLLFGRSWWCLPGLGRVFLMLKSSK